MIISDSYEYYEINKAMGVFEGLCVWGGCWLDLLSFIFLKVQFSRFVGHRFLGAKSLGRWP